MARADRPRRRRDVRLVRRPSRRPHRYALLFAGGPGQPVVDALRGYRNADGGFGHALEPDLRSPGSQPSATLYALEMLGEAGAMDDATGPRRARLDRVDRRAGRRHSVRAARLRGLSAHVLVGAGAGSFLTLALAAALHAGGVTGDAWLDRATDWCWRAIEAAERPRGYWLEIRLRLSRRRARRGAGARRGSLRWRPASTRLRSPPRPAPKARRSARSTSRRAPEPLARPGPRGAGRGAPRRRRGGAAGRRRLDVRLARLVARADDRVARRRHDPRARLAARPRTPLRAREARLRRRVGRRSRARRAASAPRASSRDGARCGPWTGCRRRPLRRTT